MLKHCDRERIIWSCDLKPNKKLLLLALNSFVDANGECWPGQELLGRMTGFTDRTVRTLCADLETENIITRSKRFKRNGHRTSDKYCLNFDAIQTQLEVQPPEKSSGGKNNHRKIFPVENNVTTTGNLRHSPPEKSSGELSSKNYPEELSSNKDVVSIQTPAKSVKPSVKKKIKKASQIYAELREWNSDQFGSFWTWYRDICKQHGYSHGDKAAAAQAWINMLKIGSSLDEFRRGCLLWSKSLGDDAVGIPHACRFIAGSKNHITPYWQSAIEDLEESGQESSFISLVESENVGEASSPSNVQSLIGKELCRLDQSSRLPADWSKRTGKAIASQLEYQDACEYLAILRQFPDKAAYQSHVMAQRMEVPHAS